MSNPTRSSRRKPREGRGKSPVPCRRRVRRPAPKPRTPSALRSRVRRFESCRGRRTILALTWASSLVTASPAIARERPCFLGFCPSPREEHGKSSGPRRRSAHGWSNTRRRSAGVPQVVHTQRRMTHLPVSPVQRPRPVRRRRPPIVPRPEQQIVRRELVLVDPRPQQFHQPRRDRHRAAVGLRLARLVPVDVRLDDLDAPLTSAPP
jgi:hypothetical protein